MKFHLPAVKIGSNIFQALAVIALVIGLILVAAFLKRTFQKHEAHYGIWSGLVAGFVLALVLEGFLLMNSKSALTSILGTKSMPRPIQNVLDGAHKGLLDILKVPLSCRNNY